MRVLFPKKKENRSARFAKAATSSYLVDVIPTHSFARCVGLVGADLDLGGCMCVYGLFATIAPASQQVTRLDLRLVFGSQSEMSSASCQFP